MPLDQREQLTLAVLLLCVPLQYFAGRYMGSNEISRSYAISKMVSELILNRVIDNLPSQSMSVTMLYQNLRVPLDDIVSVGISMKIPRISFR